MAKDIFHDIVRVSLEKEGWTITDDPLSIRVDHRDVFIDLGAEKPIFAQRYNQKIAVEIKSFVGRSPIRDLEAALGQHLVYAIVLSQREPERKLYLAVRDEVYETFFTEQIVQMILQNYPLNLIVFDAEKGEVAQWID